jgi:hypothetical protein
MIPSKYLLGIAILLFIFLSFYTVESFIQSSATRIIELEDSAPIIRIEIVYTGDPRKGTFLHLADLKLIDTKDKVIEYWKPPNSVHFEQGDTGFQGKTGPIEKLYDGDINTFAHASVAPDKLMILLKPYGENIKTIQITNRKDCCESRIKPYEMHLYSNHQKSGKVSLVELGEKGKSITYSLIQPSIATKSPSQEEKERVDFNKKWDIMASNLPDAPVIQARPHIQENSANAAPLYDSRNSGFSSGVPPGLPPGASPVPGTNPSPGGYNPYGSYTGATTGATTGANAGANAGASGAPDTVTGAASYNSYGTNSGTTNPKDCRRYGPSYSTPESRNSYGKDTIPGGPDGTHRVRVNEDSETCE